MSRVLWPQAGQEQVAEDARSRPACLPQAGQEQIAEDARSRPACLPQAGESRNPGRERRCVK